MGFSGADLQNMVNTAAIRAAVDGKDSVSMAEFEYSHDKQVLGTDWKSRYIGMDRKTLAAWIEKLLPLKNSKSANVSVVHYYSYH